MLPRSETLDRLRKRSDVAVLILGGGINGAGLFRELSCQGVDCVLLDRSDFAAGASSKSSRMIHGGLRYLENGELRLVKESLRERNRLLDNAPHFVSPLRTTIPLFSWLGGILRAPLVLLGFSVRPGGRGAILVKIGLSLYDLLTWRRRRTPTHFLTSRKKALAEMPDLHPGIVAAATYWDAAITQAERLVVELIDDACRADERSLALNYAPLEGAEGTRVRFRDGATGKLLEVRPRIVVNATGAWVDVTNAQLGLETRYMGGTKGSHLVVDNRDLYETLGDRMVYYEHGDGRICIAFRFMGRVLMGSTDIRIDDPDGATCEEDEVEYMCESLRGVFPAIHVSRDDVVYKFCGVRPLPATAERVTGRISRDHRIEANEPDDRRAFPVLSLVGGKWTTFRGLAAQAADDVLSRLELPRRTATEETPIGGGRGYPRTEEERTRWVTETAAKGGVDHERAAVLLERYGTLAERYVANLEGRGETPLAALPDYTREEIRHVAEREAVEHVTDFILRRSVIGLVGDARPEALREIAEVLSRTLGWDASRRDEEVREAEAALRV